MRLAALLLCLALPAQAQDGGTPRAVFYKVPGNAGPRELPAGYFLTEASFAILAAEMRRLQDKDRVATKSATLDIPVQGWLIGMGLTALTTMILTFGLGWYFRGKP